MTKVYSLLSSYYTLHKNMLSEDASMILQLHFEDNLSEREISERLHISIAQTKQRIARAALELRKVCNDADYLKAREIIYGKLN